MSDPTQEAPTRPRDGWVTLGIAVSAVAAGFSSFDGLKSLAEVTGWDAMAPLFALCVDSYALTAIRVWLTSYAGSERLGSFARWNAIGAIMLSLAGNAVWHLIAAGLLPITWHVVMAVGAVPPCILGLVTHLAVLRRQVAVVPAVTETRTEAVFRPMPTPQAEPAAVSAPPAIKEPATARRQSAHVRDAGELLAAARAEAAQYRAEHDGRPITRDALRRALHIGGDRATALLHQLRADSGRSAS